MEELGTELKTSSDEVQRRIKTTQDNLNQAILEGVEEFEKVELTEMRERTPVDTGELRDTSYYVPPKKEGNQIEARWVFPAEHAVYVHEDLEAFHKVGQAKFMESVINESSAYFPQRVADYVTKKLGS